MQRQYQRPQFSKSVTANNDQQFMLLEPSSGVRMKSSGQFSRNIGMESQRSAVQSEHLQQQQDCALGTERLTSLHAKLHQEADKIRKWKVQTEMDIKNKDKKLNEASFTIESLRKSILELQLENENLSTKLQEELSCREEALQRIQNTRDLIGLLKTQEEKLEEKLASCETERTELKYLEKEHAQQFEEMTGKFKKLELEAKENQQQVLSQMQQEQEHWQNREKDLQQKISEADNQIKAMVSKIDEKDIALREVHVMLQKNEEKLHATDKDLGASQQKVLSLSEDLSARQQELDKFKHECALLQGEKEQLVTQLLEERERAESAKKQEDSVQEALNNSVAIFNQRQGDMQKEVDLLKAELNHEQRRLKETRAQLTESMTIHENIKSSRDVLMLEKTEMEFCLEKLKVELTALQSDKYKDKADIVSLESEVESLKLHLEQEQQAGARLQVQVDEINPRYAALDKEKKLLQEELNTIKAAIDGHKTELEQTQLAHSEGSRHNLQLEQTLTQVQQQLADKGAELEQLQNEVQAWKDELSAKESEATSTMEQLHKLTADLQSVTEEHGTAKAYIIELEAMLTEFGKEKKCMETRLSELEQEREDLQKLKEQTGEAAEAERQNSSEKMDQLEKKVKDLTADIKAKNKAIKEHEKELKTLRGKVTSGERKQDERSREVDYLKQELASAEDSKQQMDKLIASLQTHLEQETLKAQQHANKVDQLQGEVTQLQKEKAEALAQCERQIIEMSATLERYTNDHQKLLSAKDRDMEELRSSNQHLTFACQQSDQVAAESRQETQKLYQQIAELKQDMERLELSRSSEIDSLHLQLEEQEKLVEELKENTSTLSAHLPDQPMEQESRSVPTTPVHQVVGRGHSEGAQRSILRQACSTSKRRKVAFISPSVDKLNPSTDSESSLDLDLENLPEPQSKLRTPIRLRRSPHTKLRGGPNHTIVFTPNKNSRPAAAFGTSVRQTPTRSPSNEQFTPQRTKVKEREMCKTPNMRAAPMRTSKFFRSSPKERNELKKKTQAKEKFSWFDSDTVYGFGAED